MTKSNPFAPAVQAFSAQAIPFFRPIKNILKNSRNVFPKRTLAEWRAKRLDEVTKFIEKIKEKTTMTNQAIIRNFFGKTLAVAFFAAIMTVASYAQTGNLYYQNGGAYYGRVTAFPGSHFQIDTNNGTTIKTFRNSCRPASSGGVAGVVCTFGQFDRNGRHIYSGWGYFFQNGIVYLMWTNENVAGNHWRQISTPWYAFRP